jgi:hypothetical protein
MHRELMHCAASELPASQDCLSTSLSLLAELASFTVDETGIIITGTPYKLPLLLYQTEEKCSQLNELLANSSVHLCLLCVCLALQAGHPCAACAQHVM